MSHKENPPYPWSVALMVAKKFLDALQPVTSRVEIAGSLRRRKMWVHDIDIVIEPTKTLVLESHLLDLVIAGKLEPVKGGTKMKQFVARQTGIPIDLYIASQETWATLLLIRTGSKEHNIRLCQRARQLGMMLHASGEGIQDAIGRLLPIYDEKDIFQLLKLPYKEPESRD